MVAVGKCLSLKIIIDESMTLMKPKDQSSNDLEDTLSGITLRVGLLFKRQDSSNKP